MINADALARLQQDSYARAGPSVANSWPPQSAMTANELRSFLQARHYCVLATTGAHDRAVARPVAFTVVEASLWFATVAGPRLRNLKRTPWVSIVIEDGDRGAHRAIATDGPVVLTDEPPAQLLDAWQERHGSRAEWAAAWFELRPERLLSYTAHKASA